MQQRSLQEVRVSVSLIFLIHGLIIATWASRIPAFQAHLHLSPAVLGRSLMMAAIGSILAMPAAGWLIHKFGSLSIVIGSTLGFCLARRDAREAIPASHHVVIPRPVQLGWNGRICVRGIGCFTCGSGRDSLLGQWYSTWRDVPTRIWVASASLSI
jgi:MFS family permease